MMKKSLYVVFVLALVAQICARPADEKIDPEKAKDAVVTAATDVKDKGTKDVHEAADATNKHPGSDTIKHGEGVADSANKNGKEDCHKDAKGHHGGMISGNIKRATAIGEEFVKKGENILENIFKGMGL